MKKIILLLFIVACSSINKNKSINNEFIDFNKDLTFDEFKYMLEKYSNSINYPDIDK
jgi:hypothetical protein